MSLTALLGQISLSPPLNVRLIALVVIEVVLLALVVALWFKYEQFKKISVDEWWERRRRAGVSPRVERMMRESHDAVSGRTRRGRRKRPARRRIAPRTRRSAPRLATGRHHRGGVTAARAQTASCARARVKAPDRRPGLT